MKKRSFSFNVMAKAILSLFFLWFVSCDSSDDGASVSRSLNGDWINHYGLEITVANSQARFKNVVGEWRDVYDAGFRDIKAGALKMTKIKKTGEFTYSCDDLFYYYQLEDGERRIVDIGWEPTTITLSEDGDAFITYTQAGNESYSAYYTRK